MTTQPVLDGPQEVISAEKKFMESLTSIFGKDFSAKVYPGSVVEITKAKVNTDQVLEGDKLHSLINLAAKWKLHLEVGRSGAGLKVHFNK